MTTSRSVVRSRFLLAIATILSLLANHCTNAEEPRSFDSRKQDWEQRLDEFVKKPPSDMISDPLQSLGINNFAADCTVQMTYSPSELDSMQFKFMKGDKELVAFPGHTKSVFGARQNILVFVSYGRGSDGAAVTAFDLKAGKELWKNKLDGIGMVGHFVYLNEVSMQIWGGHDPNSDSEVLVEGHESFGSYLEVRDLKTGKLIAHKKFTNEEYQRRNNSTEK
jgi:hypothetical protein